MKNKVELLAPSGNFDCVRAAISNGANAVYLGGRLFNARAFAANFDNEELKEVCDFCHLYDAKVYVTVNTLYKNEEFPELISFIDELYAMGVDGLIMQDIGAIALVRKYWPDLPVHVSTQLTSNSLEDIKWYEREGVRTAVLSRELSLEEIRNIKANTSMRIETFIHGALCVSYSGQCLMSSVLGARSGNRGKCAQNCRMNYALVNNGREVAQGHLLSTKDICTLDVLPDILEAGVDSLKIEGRMKSPEYVAGVTAIYRKYIDRYYSDPNQYKVEEADRQLLRQLFNRGGFSSGYYKTHSGADMMCPEHPRNWGVYAGEVTSYRNGLAEIRFSKDMNTGDGIEIWTGSDEGEGCYLNKACKKNEKLTVRIAGNIRKGQKVYQTSDRLLMDRLGRTVEKIDRKTPIRGFISIKANEETVLSLWHGDVRVTVKGEIPSEALNQPLTEELVAGQLNKLGNTPFELENLKVIIDDGLYLNRSALNSLKSEATEQLEKAIKQSYKREYRKPELPPLVIKNEVPARKLTVEVRNEEQFAAALDSGVIDTIYYLYSPQLVADLDSLVSRAHEKGVKLVIRLNRIWRKYIADKIRLADLLASDIDGFLISNTAHLNALKDKGKPLYLDYTGNIVNDHARQYWKQYCARIGLSIENSYDELEGYDDRKDLEIPVYGRLPLMLTHQCPIGNFAGNKKNRMYCSKANEKGYLLVSENSQFILDNDCDNCLCTIYTAKPFEAIENLPRLKAGYLRLSMLNETGRQVSEIIGRYARAIGGQKEKAGTESIRDLYNRSVR